MTVTLTVPASGLRADQFLSQTLDQLTRSAAQRLLEEGRVFLDGKALKKNHRLQAGDQVQVHIPDPEPVADLQPQDIPLDVVYEDADVIVVNKPVGLVVHPAPGSPTAAAACRGSMGPCGRGSSTASTGTPAACSSPQKTTPPT